jgi:hypothetical protein
VKRQGLNQTDFGRLIGKPQSVVSRLEGTEYGGVNVNTLLQIAYALNIALEVKFCDFGTIVRSDVSPDGLKVENIYETINMEKVKTLSAEVFTQTVATWTAIAAKNVSTLTSEGVSTWPISPTSNQQQTLSHFPGSGTLNFVMFTPTQARQV